MVWITIHLSEILHYAFSTSFPGEAFCSYKKPSEELNSHGIISIQW